MTTTEERERWQRIDDNYRRLQAIAERNKCHCGAILLVAWGGAYGRKEHILRCRNGHINEETVRDPTLWELWQRGELGDPYIAEWYRKKEEKRMAQDGVNTTALETYAQKKQLTKAEAHEVILEIWADAPQDKRNQAAILCADYGLHPLKKHVFLVPYNRGKPNEKWEMIMGIGAARLLAARSGPTSYIGDTPRIMTDAEQMVVRQKVDPDNLWAITVVRDPRTGATARGYGYYPMKGGDLVGGGEIERGSYGKGNSRENMAMIRSERQALDRLRPGELPGNVQVVDEAYMPNVSITEVEPLVDQETGEMLEGKVTNLPQGMPEPTDAAGEVQQETTAGTSGAAIASTTPEATEPEQDPQEALPEILRVCPEHRIEWFKHEQYGYLHDKPEGGKCYLRSILTKAKDTKMAEVGKTNQWLSEHMKAEYAGKTWSQVTDEQRLEVLESKFASWLEEAPTLD